MANESKQITEVKPFTKDDHDKALELEKPKGVEFISTPPDGLTWQFGDEKDCPDCTYADAIRRANKAMIMDTMFNRFLRRYYGGRDGN